MTTSPFTVRVSGTVNVDEMDYAYEAKVTGSLRQCSQKHPYGDGTALELWCEVDYDDVEIVEIEPDSEDRRVHAAIEEDAKEKAENQ